MESNFTIEEIEHRVDKGLMTEITNLSNLSEDERNNLTILTIEDKIIICTYDKELQAFKSSNPIKTNQEFNGFWSYRTDYYQFKYVKRLFKLSEDKIINKNYNNISNPFNDEQENLLYRVPDISEFVDGFEYEIWSDGFDDGDLEDFCGWYTYKFGEFPNWRELDEIKQELLNNNSRVKIK